jgi:D-alanyl-D-alanine carboxypeptidase
MTLPPKDISALATACAAVLLTLSLSSVHHAQSKAPTPAPTQGSAPAAPQESGSGVIPDTPAAKQFAAWLDVFNAGDAASIRQYLEQNRTDGAANLDGMMAMREQTGGFVVRKTIESTPTRFAVLAQERDSDQFGQLAITVDAAPPHKFGRIEMRGAPSPPEFAIPRQSEREALGAFLATIERAASAGRFDGAAIVAKREKTLFSAAYGMADREKGIKNTLDTKFRIGSMNKMFTAVAVLQLVQAGKISLTATLGTYLTDYPNKDVAAKVTVHHLLTHTGGTGDIFGPQFSAKRAELKTIGDYVTLYGARGLDFEPGSQWRYSNYGFMLLGAIIEKVSGKTYFDYVRDAVFVPAGMTSTGSQPEDEAVPNRSIGYTKMPAPTTPGQTPAEVLDKRVWRPNTDSLPHRGTSAGGGYSTAGDMVRFANALLGHKLLDAKHTELVTTGKVDLPAGMGGGGKYAYGFQEQAAGDTRWIGHGGGAPGQNGDLIIYPRSGYIVVALSNLDPPAAGRMAQFIGNRLPL